MSIAEKKYQIVEITGDTYIDRLDTYSFEAVHQYWTSKYDDAVIKTGNMRNRFSRTLIEVSAQHPLKDGKYPNAEFTARLDYAIKLLQSNPKENYIIYVPGSIHRLDNMNDELSLSEAGVNYLLEHNIPEDRIFGNEANVRYMKDAGVYNSSDECYVAAQLYADQKCAQSGY